MSRPFRKPRPVLAFGAFLQSNLQLCDKVGPSVDVSRFLSCGADHRQNYSLFVIHSQKSASVM